MHVIHTSMVSNTFETLPQVFFQLEYIDLHQSWPKYNESHDILHADLVESMTLERGLVLP